VKKYHHKDHIHNLESSNEIVPVLIELFQPNSVIDVGCGTATFLHVFEREGVADITGIDGDWVDREKLAKHINPKQFLTKDLEKGFEIDKRFDLALCLEVAEHLEAKSAVKFVESLCNLSDIIVFSAAVPLQGGQNHLNEQWLSYWNDLFRANGYRIYDVLRPIFWENEKIFPWYKQNIVVFAKGEMNELSHSTSFHGANIIHPELFEMKAEQALISQYPKFWSSLKLLAKSLLK
jgi:SAM-dependent methyltransferase